MTSGENSNFELLDVLTIISFVMQLQNHSKLFSLHDVKIDNERVAEDIHRHLKTQDEKINKILDRLGVKQ